MSEDLLRRALALLPGDGSQPDRVMQTSSLAAVLDVDMMVVFDLLYEHWEKTLEVTYGEGRETPGGPRTRGWRRV